MGDIGIKCENIIFEGIILYWDKRYDIEIIDVKAVYVGYKGSIIDSDAIVTASTTNDMEFIVKMGEKLSIDPLNYYMKLDVDFFNVPRLSTITEIHIKFDVTYVIDDVIKNEFTNELTIKDNVTTEIDRKFKNLKDAPCGLKLDSIYRPFFVNSVLLLLPYKYETQYTNKNYSQDCFGRLYFSIANGCTYKVKDEDKYNEKSVYKIGDINIKLKHKIDYELTIRDSYRLVNEIYDYDDKNIVYKYWHLNGIREAGEKDVSTGLVNNVEKGIKLKRGINLLPEVNNAIISPISTFYDIYKVSSITYDNNVKLTNYDDISVDNCGLDTTYPIQFSLTINDYAPASFEPNTINIESESILFPDEITRDSESSCSFDARYYNENVSYIVIGYENHDMTFNQLNEIFEKISSIDVSDNVSDKEFLFDYLYGLVNKKLIANFVFDGNTGRYKCNNLSEGRRYIIAIYHGSNIKSDETNPFSYVKHTNKLLIMKVYNIDI